MKPTLYILAAGMGSRYGGLKQLDGLGPNGETIMDYSIYDAIQAGFGKVVFVIRKDFEDDFRNKVLSKYEGQIPCEVVFQAVDKLPEGFTCPADRTKPWGPAHAVLMAKDVIKEPFAVINADDFYGRSSFRVVAEDLMRPRDRKGDYSLVGFRVGNTMSESGGVSRGECKADDNGMLTSVIERRSIAYNDKHEIVYKDEEGVEHKLDPDTPVSMNMWGFTPDYFTKSYEVFKDFLKENSGELKKEFYIPYAIDCMIKAGEAECDVLSTPSRWFGVTYKEDRPAVVAKFKELADNGIYPSPLY